MNNTHKQNKLLTLQEVADILRINRSSVSRLLRGGDLAYIPIGGRKLVELLDLQLFIDNRKVNTYETAARDGE